MTIAKRLGVALLVALSACAPVLPPPNGPSSGARGDGHSARVLVFNIHAGKDAAGKGNLEEVAALVKSVDADLVLLQEVDRRTRRSGQVDQLQRLADLTGYFVVFGRSLDYDGGQYGIAALSRGRIAQFRTEPLPIDPPQPRAGGAYEPRAALTFTASTRLGTLAVLNTHLDASRDDRYRVQESAHILTIVRGLQSSRARLAGGDFNAEPGSVPYKQLTAAGLRDSWQECGTGEGFTYPAEKPVKRIDYLFLAGGIRCTRAEVIDTRISDHRPLLVTLSR